MTGKIPFHNSVPAVISRRVLSGKRPTKPTPEDMAFQQFGLTEAIWGFIEGCWKQMPNERPTASEILKDPLLTSLEDPRPLQEWGLLSVAEYRRVGDAAPSPIGG